MSDVCPLKLKLSSTVDSLLLELARGIWNRSSYGEFR